jgi:protein O-GlcNAc transferase
MGRPALALGAVETFADASRCIRVLERRGFNSMNRNQRRLARKQGGPATPAMTPALQDLLADGVRHHRAGRLADAERQYRRVLAMEPRHADCLHRLGVIAYQLGQHEVAIDLIGRAIAIDRKVAAYHSNLGNALKAQGRLDEAGACYRRALGLKPGDTVARNNLGTVLKALGRLDEAVACYERVLALKPEDAEVHNNLGNALLDQGRFDGAAARYERALALRPDYADAQYNLANVRQGQGRLDEAVEGYERAVALRPDHFETHNNLGNALMARGELDAAAAQYERALALRPDDAEANTNLGIVFRGQHKLDGATALFERALAARPDFAQAHYNLGLALAERGRLDEAMARYDHALALKPDYAEAHNALGLTLMGQGKVEAAVARYRRALDRKPDYGVARDNLLLCLNYSDWPAADIFAEHRRWDEVHGGAPPAPAVHLNDRDPDRRLRVGYVSGDFKRHSVAWFLGPLLSAHDAKAVEVYGYAEVARPDQTTERLKGLAHHWRSSVGMSDQALAERIRADRIDILVDLAGHTANNRLTMFARKPAPVQVSWLGYPNTTGLSAIDYRLVDAVTDPEGAAEAWASETLVRLDDGFLCYGPPPAAPEPAPPPGFADGAVTFGSFNNPSKLSAATLDAWAKVLARTPNARLLLKGGSLGDESTRAQFHAWFADRGVAPERLRLRGPTADPADHLAVYNEVDIALDPFPYNGTTTTCEALWMGAPVVTLLGERHAGRVGASLLTQVGLADLVAGDVEAYVEIAARLAGDRVRLTEIRRSLRPVMAASSLCDGPAFARKIEGAYRRMWARWCGQAEARDGPPARP